jgi:hypothetical protein
LRNRIGDGIDNRIGLTLRKDRATTRSATDREIQSAARGQMTDSQKAVAEIRSIHRLGLDSAPW